MPVPRSFRLPGDFPRHQIGRGLGATIVAGSLALLAPGCGLFDAPPPGPPGEQGGVDPRDATAAVATAERLFEKGEVEDAIFLLRDALEINPTFTPGYLSLGSMARRMGDLDAAERAFERATRVDPESYDAHYNHADVLLGLDRAVEAVRAYLEAVRLRPDAREARRGLAAAYLTLEEARQALPHARLAVELGPEDALARANYGAALSLVGQHEDAIAQYETAAELAQPTHDLLINWANSLGVLERYEEMAAVAVRARNAENTAVASERLAFANFKLGRMTDAAQGFRDALAADPSHYPALNGLGIILLNDFLASGREEQQLRTEALALLKRSLIIRSDQPRIAGLVSRFQSG